jgi:hypothetical protein
LPSEPFPFDRLNPKQLRSNACPDGGTSRRHTPLIPDEKYGAVFAPTAAAKLLKSLQLGKDPGSKGAPIADLESAIALAESALVG